MGQRQAQDLVVAARAGVQVGAVVDGIFRIHVGTGIDQDPGRLHAVVVRGQQQRRASLRIAVIDAGALAKQCGDLRGVAAGRGLAQLLLGRAAGGG
ncbi:hypothetical protein D9M72_431760 [compost metagenome]